MPCVKVGGAICCSFVDSVGSGRYRNKLYRWSFSEWFGPLFENADGSTVEPQPKPGSPAWRAFDRWMEKYREAHPRREL